MANPKNAVNARIASLVAKWSRSATFYGGKYVKQLRAEARRCASSTDKFATLLAELEAQPGLWDAEIQALKEAKQVLTSLGNQFEVAQRECDKILTRATAERDTKRANDTAEAISRIFGQGGTDESVASLCTDALEFLAAVDQWAQDKKGCRGFFSFNRDHELKSALQGGRYDRAKIIVAETYLDDLQWPGRRSDYQGESWWHAGWVDFEAWRAQRQKQNAG